MTTFATFLAEAGEVDGSLAAAYYGRAWAAATAAERERCATLCRTAMPQPVANWSDAQIVEALRVVLAQLG